MFITKTVTESAGIEIPNMTLDQYMVESACDAYEDLLSFNEALAHFDIKEQELIHTESVELDAFREDAMGKAKQFLKNLADKIKTKWNQFINFILKKMIANNKKIADRLKVMSNTDRSSLEKVIDKKELKVKFFDKVHDLPDCVDKILDFMSNAFHKIETEKDLESFNPSDIFKELVGEAKEPRPIFGEDLTKTITTLSTVGGKFTKSVEAVFNKIVDKVTYSASGDEKEAARHITLVNLKGQQVIRVAFSALVSLANTCAGVLIRVYHAYSKELNNKNKINPSNPLSKLYSINEQVCLDLINLWETYNTTYRKSSPIIIDSISFNYAIRNKIKTLFKELDDELMKILEKQDENTMKLLDLKDIDSYQKLHMLIIAPQEVEYIK